MFSWIQKVIRTEPPEDKILDNRARLELVGQIKVLLLNHHTVNGADSLLDSALRVVATQDGISLLSLSHPEAICEVRLRELPTILSFLVVREDGLAIPRDVVADIAYEAARLVSKRINLLSEPH